MFKQYTKQIVDFDDVVAMLDKAFNDDAPTSTQETGFIKKGFSKELDELKEKASGGRSALANMDAQEKQNKYQESKN